MDGDGGRAPAARHGDPRREGLWLGLFTVLLAVVWATEYQPFLLPNNDYASFERVARSFAALELPSSFKRMPILPGLMALLAPAMPGPHPYLHAALVWNFAFSLGTLWLLFGLARRSIGRGALLVPLCVGTSVQVHAMGLQPLVEPSLAFFVVAAFVLFERGSPWQWAAAFCVALSRYDAGMIVPALFVANVWRDRDRLGPAVVRHGGGAVLATSGVLVWTGLSVVHGRGAGGSFYLELMEGMGWQPALGFFERSVKEPFRGWYVRSKLAIPFFLVAVGIPGLLGLRAGLARFRSLTVALALFWILGVGVVVVFGIDKARYVTHTQWIPLFFWAAGLPVLADAIAARVARAGPALARLAAGGAGALVVLATAWWLRELARAERALALGPEVALLLGVLALGGGVLLAGRRGRAGWAGGLAALFLFVPFPGGGLESRSKELYKVYHANHSAAVLADWMAANLGDDRAVVLPRTHVEFLVGIGSPQLVLFSSFEAETPEAMAAAMREQGIRYAVYTYRSDPDDPAEEFYYRLHHMRIAEFFESGGPVPGFRHVATLPVPEELERRPVQIYELSPPLGETSEEAPAD